MSGINIDTLLKMAPRREHRRLPIFTFDTPLPARSEPQFRRQHQPFEAFWLVFETENEMFGTISAALLVLPEGLNAFQKLPVAGLLLPTSGGLLNVATVPNTGQRNAVERDFVGDYMAAMERINEPHERLEAHHRVRGEWLPQGGTVRVPLIRVGAPLAGGIDE